MQSPSHLYAEDTRLENVNLSPSDQVTSDAGSRMYTFGQVAAGSVVTGKPTTNAVAMEILSVPPRSSDPAEMTLHEAEVIWKEWREAKWVFLAWLIMTAVFSAFYAIYLERLYLALAAGVVLTVITSGLYYSPWFKTSDGIFTILAFMVGTFMTDFVCAFLSIVFGFNDSTVLGCGALIFVHGSLTLYLFRRYKSVLAAASIVEKARLPIQNTSSSQPPLSTTNML